MLFILFAVVKFCVFLFLNANPPKEFFTAVDGCFFVTVGVAVFFAIIGVGSFCFVQL
jgi:hypothetical protein